MVTWNDIIQNEFKSLLRRPGGMDTLVAKILLLVLIVIFAAYFAVIGYMLPNILKHAKTGHTPLEIINGIMVYYLLADLFMRLLWQQIPAGIITQYLVLNISRKKIVSFLLTKTFFNIPTAVGFALWCAFSISQFGISLDGLMWLASVILFLLVNSLLMTIIKNSFDNGLKGTLTALGIIITIGGTNYFGLIHFSEVIKKFLRLTAYEHQVFILVPLSALFVLMSYTRKTILSATYREITAQYSLPHVQSTAHTDEFFSFWSFEWKQFWRNKRIKTMFFTATIMFTFLFVTNIINQSNSSGWLSIFPVVMLYVLIVIPLDPLLRLNFSKESVYYDKLSTVPFSWKDYLKRNYAIGAAAALIFYLIIFISLSIVSKHRLSIWASIIVVFHLGITSFLIMHRSTFNKTRFHNETSAWFNYGGISSAPWYIESIVLGDMILAPILIVLLFLFFSEIAAMLSLSFVGIAGVAFSKNWFAMLYRAFLKRRYHMMEGFRAAS
jgi:hypothetical protein